MRSLSSPFFALLLLATACGSPPRVAVPEPAAPAGLVIQDVRVFQGADDELLEARDVFVRGDRIDRITATGAELPEVGARVIDGKGGTLLPGFIDLHVHVGGLESPPWKARIPEEALNLQRMLYAGITTAVDLGGPLKKLRKMSREISEGRVAGPELFFTGPHVGIRDGHPAAMVSLFVPWPIDRLLRPDMSFEVRNANDVERAVEQVVKGGGRFLKITVDEIPLDAPKLDRTLAQHAIETAHRHGLKVLAHIGTNADLQVALDAGVDALAHGVYREALSEDLAERLASQQVPVIPTVGVFTAIERLMHEGPEDSQLFRELTSPEVRATLADKPAKLSPASVQGWMDETHEARAIRVRNVALLREKGATVLVGSDSNNIGWTAGAAFHRELEYLVEAGYSPAQAIELATTRNASFLGLADRGRIVAGARADLVLVSGDPTVDVSATRDIVAVVQAGKEVKRAAPYR